MLIPVKIALIANRVCFKTLSKSVNTSEDNTNRVSFKTLSKSVNTRGSVLKPCPKVLIPVKIALTANIPCPKVLIPVKIALIANRVCFKTLSKSGSVLKPCPKVLIPVKIALIANRVCFKTLSKSVNTSEDSIDSE